MPKPFRDYLGGELLGDRVVANVQFLSVVPYLVSKFGISINFLISSAKGVCQLLPTVIIFCFFFPFLLRILAVWYYLKGPIKVSCEDWMKNRKVQYTQFKKKIKLLS